MHTIGCFRLASDSSTSAYAPSENPLSPIYSNYHSAHMSESNMSEDHLVPQDCLSILELAMDDMKSQSDTTQTLLESLLKWMGPVPTLQEQNNTTQRLTSCQPTSIPTSSASQKISLKPSNPSKFNGDQTKGKESSCPAKPTSVSAWRPLMTTPPKIVWAMSYMKSGHAGWWATWEFEYEATSEDQKLHFLDWLDFEDKFHKDFLPSTPRPWLSTPWRPQPTSKRRGQ